MIGYRFLAGLLTSLAFVASAQTGPLALVPDGTVTISVTGSSAATALPRPDADKRQVEIQNNGTVVVFVKFCNSSTCTATTSANYPILPSQSKVVTIPPDSTHIGAIGASAGPTTLYVTMGIGL